MIRLRILAAALVLFAVSSPAQKREYLHFDEIDQLREGQEANDRLKLYALFAGKRLDAIEKELTGKMTEDRGTIVHDLLWEYQQIVDALDDVADLAGTKRDLVRKGLDVVLRLEPDYLKRLQAIEEKNPADRESFRFALTEAIDSTKSSLEDSKKLMEKQPAASKSELKKEQKEREADEKFEKEKEKAAKKKPH